MPTARRRTKLKTKKAALKRLVGVSSRGKVVVRARSNQHLAARKSKRTLRGSSRAKVLGGAQAKNFQTLLPYVS
jgi:ribosomal protein L35